MADLIDIGFRVQGADQAAEQIKGITNETKKLEGEQKKAETSVKSYAAQIKQLRLELISLGERTKENATQYDNVASRIKDLSEKQEDLVIGTKKLDEQLSALPGPLGKLGNMFQNFEGIVKNVRGAKIALIKQFPILKNAIAATGIGALVIVFGLLVGAVIKAFNSFKPLQDAVGRLGVAFELLDKLVQPVINLIGTGLTTAVDFAARSIAFLTGNLEEYNKEVANKKTTEQLKAQIEQQNALYELNKDKFTQLEREKGDAYQANLQRFREIDGLEGLSTQQKNERKRASNALYYRDLQRAQQAQSDRDKEAAKREKERLEKANQLTQSQIDKIKELSRIQIESIQRRIGLLKTREIEGLGNIEDIESLKNATEFWNNVLRTTSKEVEKLQKTLDFLEPADPGFNVLQRELLFLTDTFNYALKLQPKEALESFKTVSQVIFREVEFAGDIFLKDVKAPLKAVIRDYENLLKQLQEIKLTNQEDVANLTNSIIEYERQQREGGLIEEGDAERRFYAQRQKFIEAFIVKESEFKKQKLEDDTKLTAEQIDKQIKDSQEAFRQLGEAAFNEFSKSVLVIQAFSQETEQINKTILELNKRLKKAADDGSLQKLLGDVIQKDLPQFVSLIEQIDKTAESSTNALSNMVDELSKFIIDSKSVGKPIESGMNQAGAAINKIKELFASLDARFVISDEIATKILENLIEKRISADLVLKQLNTEYLSTQYDGQLAALEAQKKIDAQLLKDKGATQEQMIALDEMYAKRKQRIDDQYTLYVMDQTAMIFGNLASFFHEETVAFKALKYFEAMITAISSSVKAYESALAYGGPAGPILAPILGATTFAVQQQQAMKILQTSVPTPPNLTGREGGLVFGRTHEQGGVNAELEGGEFILNRRTMMIPGVADLALRLNNIDPLTPQTQGSSQVVKAYVLSGEITTAQKADKRIRDLSRL